MYFIFAICLYFIFAICMYFIFAICLYFIFAICLSIAMILYMFNYVLIWYVCQLSIFKISSRLKNSKELTFYVVFLYMFPTYLLAYIIYNYLLTFTRACLNSYKYTLNVAKSFFGVAKRTGQKIHQMSTETVLIFKPL